MGISYRGLRELLIERGIQRKTLKNDLGLSSKTVAKINKDEYLDLETLELIGRYLGVQVGDMISFKN
jgi:putative transcriptional regulator